METNNNGFIASLKDGAQKATLAVLGTLAIAGCGTQQPAPFVPTTLSLTGREQVPVEDGRALFEAPNRTEAAVYADLANGSDFVFTPSGEARSAPVPAGETPRGVDRIAIGYDVNERFGGEKEALFLGTLSYTANTPDGREEKTVEVYAAPDMDPGRTLENFTAGWTRGFREELAGRIAQDMEVCYEGELASLNANQVLQYFERAAEQATGSKDAAPQIGYSFAPDQLRDSEGFVKTFDFNRPGVSTSAADEYDLDAICDQVPRGFIVAWGNGYDARTQLLDRLADQGVTGHGLEQSYNAGAAERLNAAVDRANTTYADTTRAFLESNNR
jgi:hypothetical protein